MQFGCDPAPVGFGRSGSVAFFQLGDLLVAGTAAANLWPAAWCGHRRTPGDDSKVTCGSRTCKPNSVRRIAPAGRSFLWAAHYCAAQATYPEVVARRAGTRLGRSRELPPYLVLLRVGFAMPAALLRRRCALTAPFHPYLDVAARRYVFCGTFRRPGLNPASRTLSGTLLCGVRTFLPPT